MASSSAKFFSAPASLFPFLSLPFFCFDFFIFYDKGGLRTLFTAYVIHFYK
jgi:hypothetical protein